MFRYNRAMSCISGRKDWDKKWGEGNRHAAENARQQRAAEKAANDIAKYCKGPKHAIRKRSNNGYFTEV